MKRYWKKCPPDYDAMPAQDRQRIARKEAAKACPAFRRWKSEPILAGLGRRKRRRITSTQRRERMWRVRKLVEQMKRRRAA